MARRNNVWANIDWITVSIYLILIILGWINIYAAVYNEEHRSIFDFSQRYGKQIIWIFAAIIISFFVLIVDSKFYVTFAIPMYLAMILLLIFVLLFGAEVKGARSWFQIGSFAIQPSEFAKLATALALAKYLSTYNLKIERFKTLATIGVILMLPVLLIFLQNDTGSALVFSVFILVLYREGLSGVVLFFVLLVAIVFVLTLVLTPLTTVIIITVSALATYYMMRRKNVEVIWAVATLGIIFGLSRLINLIGLDWSFYQSVVFTLSFSLLVFLVYAYRKRIRNLYLILMIFFGLLLLTTSVNYVFQNVLEQHQRSRINELLGIESNPLGAGYNVNQSKIAIGSGGFWGKGFLKGTQTKFDFVPEQSTDFIFCTVGEEWGFIGTIIIIGLFLFLLLRLLKLADRQRSKFSRIYGYSVATILFFHFSINIGMTIGLAPVIGIPLPFFSYGGSSLWSFTILLFIFLRLDASRYEVLN